MYYMKICFWIVFIFIMIVSIQTRKKEPEMNEDYELPQHKRRPNQVVVNNNNPIVTCAAFLVIIVIILPCVIGGLSFCIGTVGIFGPAFSEGFQEGVENVKSLEGQK